MVRLKASTVRFLDYQRMALQEFIQLAGFNKFLRGDLFHSISFTKIEAISDPDLVFPVKGNIAYCRSIARFQFRRRLVAEVIMEGMITRSDSVAKYFFSWRTARLWLIHYPQEHGCGVYTNHQPFHRHYTALNSDSPDDHGYSHLDVEGLGWY